MRKNKSIVFVWLIILLSLFILVGCSQNSAEVDPTAVSVVEEETETPVSEATETIEAVQEEEINTTEDESAEEEMAVVPEEPNYCLECHTDQQMLIDTAKPEEVVISESEGEG